MDLPYYSEDHYRDFKMATTRLFYPTLITLITFIFIPGSAIYTDQTVEILDLSVPRFPKTGEDVILTCRFKLGGPKHRLYTVNWWRGKDQFFTYKKNNFQPKHAYSFRGIDVKVEESTEEMVVLKNVNEDTSGVYKCEVMGEGPAFRTAVDTMEMHVIVPPERMEISHGLNRHSLYQYKIEDIITLNCTAHRVKPRPHLIWRINGQEVKRSEVQRYPDFEDHHGRVTSTLGLHFMAPKHFVNRVAKVSCTAFVEGHEFTKEEILQLDPSAAFHLYSSGDVIRPIRIQIFVFAFCSLWRTWLS